MGRCLVCNRYKLYCLCDPDVLEGFDMARYGDMDG